MSKVALFLIRIFVMGLVWLKWILMMPTGVVLTFDNEFKKWQWVKTGRG